MVVGWYDHPSQQTPSHDPGVVGTDCPLCGYGLTAIDVRTYSVMQRGGSKSVFYRVHRSCAEDATEAMIRVLDQRAMQAVLD